MGLSLVLPTYPAQPLPAHPSPSSFFDGSFSIHFAAIILLSAFCAGKIDLTDKPAANCL